MKYQTLRTLFIIGFAISIITTFLPAKRVTMGEGFYGFRGQERTISNYQEIRLAFTRNPSAALFIVVLFAIQIAFLILAITFPKRWVFLAGAIFSAFFLLLALFVPSQEGVRYLAYMRILDYIAVILPLTGFFIKPQQKDIS